MTDPETVQRASRALRVFRGMQPTLTTYAQMLTGRPDVRVVAATESNGATDGTKIFYRPPLALGDEVMHQKWNCDKRDELGRRKCPACEQRETVLSTVYHEIAHIWFESFAKTHEYDKKQVLARAIKERGGKYAEEIRRRIGNAPERMYDSYMGLAKLISEFLPLIINALEDARVNRELFKAMPGVRVMFAAKTMKIFDEGVEQMNLATGEWENTPWREYPLNLQVICGLYCKASGYKYDDWFYPEVVDALGDDELTELVDKTSHMSSISDIYGLAFPVLARLRELGFCRLDDDPEDDTPPPPPPPTPPQESEEEPEQGDEGQDGDPGDSSEEPGEQEDAEPDTGDSDGEAGEQTETDHGGDDSSPSSPGEDQQEEGDDDPDSGTESGSSDSADEGPSSSDSEGEPGESGEVDADGTQEDGTEGPQEDGPETDGSSGEPGGDQDLGGTPGGDRSEHGGDDPGGEPDLAEDSGYPGEGGSDAEAETGDDPGQGEAREAQAGGAEPDLSPAGDGNPDLGGPEGLDPADGEGLEGEPDEGADPDGPDAGGGDDDGEVDPEPEDSVEPIDTGPFSHGTTIHDDGSKRPEMGTPDDCETALKKLGDHEPPTDIDASQLAEETEAIEAAIIQGMYFETPSATVLGIDFYDFPEELYANLPHHVPGISTSTGLAWSYNSAAKDAMERILQGIDGDWTIPEATIAPSLLKARIAFSENLRGGRIGGKKSGRVSARHLGKRAPFDDPRMFAKKIRPTKRNYFDLIMIDISGSTKGKNIALAKHLCLAQAELLSRLGVKFAIYAHSGTFPRGTLDNIQMHVYNVKHPDEPWDDRARTRVEKLGPDGINLDGHAVELGRKILDKRPELVKIFHYYTDGAMPAANAGEELIVLQREILECRKRGYILKGVGIRTDSPRQHGLDTFQIDEVSDLSRVIADLEKELVGR